MLIAMDMSMRSSGLIVLEPNNNIIDFRIIQTTKEDFPDHENLIIHIIDDVLSLIDEYNPDIFVIEGMAFAGLSKFKDVIAGIYWGVRAAIWKEFPEILIGSVPVASWRAPVLNKEDRKYAKENFSPKADVLKIATVKKLPADVHDTFIKYITSNGYNKKKMYDLTDAYFLGVYRNSL
jgi:hypothetical protein